MGPAFEQLVHPVCVELRRLLADRPFSLYVVGSHADGTAARTSDVDLALILPSGLPARETESIGQTVRSKTDAGDIPVDWYYLTFDSILVGVTPQIKAGRLLAGRDVLANAPLLPKPELMLQYTGLVLHFAAAVRGLRGAVVLPFQLPSEREEFFGYDKNGIRVRTGEYVAGFNMLVNLVTTLAAFRLAWLRDVFTTGKAETASRYRQVLPSDEWVSVVEDVYRIGRLEAHGAGLSDHSRHRLAECCSRLAELENACMDVVIDNIDAWLPSRDSVRQHKARLLLRGISSRNARQQSVIAGLQRKHCQVDQLPTSQGK